MFRIISLCIFISCMLVSCVTHEGATKRIELQGHVGSGASYTLDGKVVRFSELESFLLELKPPAYIEFIEMDTRGYRETMIISEILNQLGKIDGITVESSVRYKGCKYVEVKSAPYTGDPYILNDKSVNFKELLRFLDGIKAPAVIRYVETDKRAHPEVSQLFTVLKGLEDKEEIILNYFPARSSTPIYFEVLEEDYEDLPWGGDDE